MSKKIAIVNTHSPFNTPIAKESLDLALIFGAFDQQVAVIFLGNGVYQLIQGQQPEALDTKDFLSTMKALELYDIEQLVCCSDSLDERGLTQAALSADVALMNKQQIGELLGQFDHVVMQ